MKYCFDSFQIFKNVKTIFSSWVLQKQVTGQIFQPLTLIIIASLKFYVQYLLSVKITQFGKKNYTIWEEEGEEGIRGRWGDWKIIC